MSSSSIFDQISEAQFMAAYNKYASNAWTKFTFRFFSTSTVQKDKWVNTALLLTMVTMLFLGFAETIAGLPKEFIAIPTYTLATLLLAIGILKGGAFIMNNLRIKKIIKTLGITQTEYNLLADVYLD